MIDALRLVQQWNEELGSAAGLRWEESRIRAWSRRLESRGLGAIAPTNRRDLVEVERSERSDGLATEGELADRFLHRRTIAQRS